MVLEPFLRTLVLVLLLNERYLSETFPVRELFDLEYTGRLEKTLSDIERKKHTKKEFLDFVTEFVKTSVEEIKKDQTFGNAANAAPLHTGPVGKCPECGAELKHEGGCNICHSCGYSKCG